MINKIKATYSHEAFRFASKAQFEDEWKFAREKLKDKKSGEKVSRGTYYFNHDYYKLETKHSFIKIDNQIYALASNKPYKHLGKGSFGEVHFAMDEDCVLYAMKIQQKKDLSIYSSMEAFVNWDLGFLSNIPANRIYQKEEKNISKLYMPLLFQGGSLHAKLKSQELTKKEAIDLLIKMTIEVQQLHESESTKTGMSYTHHDLKPRNILLSNNHTVLIDYGFAAEATDQNARLPFHGTATYLPFGGKYNKDKRMNFEAKKIAYKNMQLLGAKGVDNFALKRIAYLPSELFQESSLNNAEKKAICLFTPNTYKQLPKRLQEIFHTADSPQKVLDVSVHKDHTALFLAALLISYEKDPAIDIEALETELLASVNTQKTILRCYLKEKNEVYQTKPWCEPNKLITLIRTGNLNEFKNNSSQYQAELNKTDNEGLTPIHYAVSRKDLSWIKALCQMGADPNILDNFGQSPIWEAMRHNDKEVITTLVEYGANVNLPQPEGITPLMIAAQNNSPILDDLLAIKKIDIHQTDYLNRTAVFFAIETKQVDALKKLHKAGASLNMQTIHGLTPAFEAVYENNFPALQFLIEHNVPINQRDFYDESLLFLATYKGRSEMVEYLLDKTEGIYWEDIRTKLDLNELVRGKDEETVNEMDCFIQGKLIDGEDHDAITITPLDIAVILGNKKIIDSFKNSHYEMHKKYPPFVLRGGFSFFKDSDSQNDSHEISSPNSCKFETFKIASI